MRKRPRIGNRGLSLHVSIPRPLRFSYTNWLPRQELSASPSPAGHWWKPTYGKKLCLPHVSFSILTGFPGLPSCITYYLHNKPLQNFIYWLMCLWVVWVIFLFQAGWDGTGWSWQPHSHGYGLNWADWAGKVGLGGWGFSSCSPSFSRNPDQLSGFPGGASGKESTCQCRRHKRHGFDPWVRKIPWRRAWQPTPVFLPGESHGQRSLLV